MKNTEMQWYTVTGTLIETRTVEKRFLVLGKSQSDAIIRVYYFCKEGKGDLYVSGNLYT